MDSALPPPLPAQTPAESDVKQTLEEFVDANENAPSAPDDLPSYANYAGMNNAVMLPALPPPPPTYAVAVNDASAWATSNCLSEEEALGALREHCRNLCCWGEGPVDKMKIKSITPSTAYKYRINTWTENRETSWKQEAYWGGEVDGHANGKPPSAWEVPVDMPAAFVDVVYAIRVPHTENIRACSRCYGRGQVTCTRCGGTGHRYEGSGDHRRRVSCPRTQMCWTCTGSGKLKHYIELKVTFQTHGDDYVYETTDLPDELILKATGKNMFEETADRIGPILNYYINDINLNSAKLVGEHASNWPMERTWKQSHKLESVPVYEIKYAINDEGRFWVFGDNKLVFSADYPAQCCCCFNCPGLCDNCSCCNSCSIL